MLGDIPIAESDEELLGILEDPRIMPGARGDQLVHGVTMRQLYEQMRRRLEYFHPDRSDPDATCQAFCCEIERLMGIYPNVPGLEDE